MYALRGKNVRRKMDFVEIPDLVGLTKAMIRTCDRRINIKLLGKELGLQQDVEQVFGSKEWITVDAFIEFASRIDSEWHSRLRKCTELDSRDNTINKSRDIRLRRKHIQTEQCVYGAMVGVDKFKIGCTDLGVTARMVDMKRKLRFDPIIAFVYKVSNPKAVEREIFRDSYLKDRQVEYMGIKREVFSIPWKDVKYVKKIVRTIVASHHRKL